MKLDIQEVARAVGAAGEAPPSIVDGWSVDTRTQNPGDVYFALRGANLDGHDFVAAAVEKGAAAVVVERRMGAPVELAVPDSQRALEQLAAWARGRWGGTVVAVTGSAGKTTTKDAIAHLLAVEMPVGKTEGNFNNHVGVPLSILRLPEGCRTAVLEMGMNHAGEIRDLAAIGRPEIGVVTNVGYAHVENFHSIDGVAAAKRELIEGLPRQGVAVLNADDERALRFREAHAGRSVTFGFSEGAEVRAAEARFGAEGARFRALGVEFETAVPGPPRRHEPAGGHRHGIGVRHCAGTAARGRAVLLRREDAGGAPGARRRGGVERLLQLEPRGGGSDAGRPVADPRRAPHRRAGRNARTGGARPRNYTGAWAGTDRRAGDRFRVWRARPCGGAGGRRRGKRAWRKAPSASSRTRPKPERAPGNWPVRATRCSSRARAASAWNAPSESFPSS